MKRTWLKNSKWDTIVQFNAGLCANLGAFSCVDKYSLPHKPHKFRHDFRLVKSRHFFVSDVNFLKNQPDFTGIITLEDSTPASGTLL